MPKDTDITEENEHSADLPDTTSEPGDDVANEDEDLPAEPSEERRPGPSITYNEPTKSQRMLQIVGGWAFGFLVWFFLALGSMYPANELLNWLFLVVFLIAMLLRAQVEKKTGISMRPFMMWLLISLVVFLIVFIILGPVTHILI